jgi:hypothetical protein
VGLRSRLVGNGGRASTCRLGLEASRLGEDADRMRPIEFEIERTVRAPIDDVFARLIDIDGHNTWMANTAAC